MISFEDFRQKAEDYFKKTIGPSNKTEYERMKKEYDFEAEVRDAYCTISLPEIYGEDCASEIKINNAIKQPAENISYWYL